MLYFVFAIKESDAFENLRKMLVNKRKDYDTLSVKLYTDSIMYPMLDNHGAEMAHLIIETKTPNVSCIHPNVNHMDVFNKFFGHTGVTVSVDGAGKYQLSIEDKNYPFFIYHSEIGEWLKRCSGLNPTHQSLQDFYQSHIASYPRIHGRFGSLTMSCRFAEMYDLMEAIYDPKTIGKFTDAVISGRLTDFLKIFDEQQQAYLKGLFGYHYHTVIQSKTFPELKEGFESNLSNIRQAGQAMIASATSLSNLND